MKKLLHNLLALILLLTVGTGVKAQNESLLYKISGNGLDQPSYLFGTIHMICKEDMLMTESIQEALDKTSQLVLEIDMSDSSYHTKISLLSLNEGMKNLSNELKEEELNLLNNFFTAHYGANMSQLGVVRPFGLMSMMYMKAVGCDQLAFYEATFMEMNGDKKVLGLETIESQMAVIAKIPQKEQIEWLVESATDFESMKEDFTKMVDIYLTQDIEKLHDHMDDNTRYAKYNDSMLYNRNSNWIEPIKSMISEKSSFIAVGAAHLGSDKGVIALLKKEGYTVEPVLN